MIHALSSSHLCQLLIPDPSHLLRLPISSSGSIINGLWSFGTQHLPSPDSLIAEGLYLWITWSHWHRRCLISAEVRSQAVIGDQGMAAGPPWKSGALTRALCFPSRALTQKPQWWQMIAEGRGLTICILATMTNLGERTVASSAGCEPDRKTEGLLREVAPINHA